MVVFKLKKVELGYEDDIIILPQDICKGHPVSRKVPPTIDVA
jgi:hypothetical protein